MRFDLLNVVLLAGIPLCAAGAASLTKYLSQFALEKVVIHPAFFAVMLMGGYEFFAGWYLYKPNVLHENGVPMSVMEPTIIIATILIGVLIGVGIWREVLNPTRAIMLSVITPQLIVFLVGKFPPWQ